MNTTTVSLADIATRLWDVVIVGAGVAGGVAARAIAARGLSVLVVEKTVFPRSKVCGCCLNPATLTVLDSVGLGPIIDQCEAATVDIMRLGVRGRYADLHLPGWRALSRRALDSALVAAAVDHGAEFLPNTEAVLGPSVGDHRVVRLRSEGQQAELRTKLLLAADGLGGRLLGSSEGCEAIVTPGSRIGAGVVVEGGPACYLPGRLDMAYGTGGYVGLVRLEDGRLNIAAAFDVDRLRSVHAPGVLAASILDEVGWEPIPHLAELPWRGTPALTRQRTNPAGERVLVLGDAAGYIEPFTGEGIGWAAASAAAVVPFAEQAVRQWQSSISRQWSESLRRAAKRRQWFCRAITWITRHPRISRLVVSLLSWMPWLGRPLVAQMRAGTLK